ncbi:MAG: hypothetical protein RI101_03135 [Nitrospira sp.]|jgi:HEPN domain-containing protein|nr:hypothetical protein [Nitrospira sp.]
MQADEAPKDLGLKKTPGLDRQEILQTWIKSGIEDFYLSFELEDRWHRHSIFYCHQGLEKICKAYHIGKSSARWEKLNDASALKEIDRIAKSLNHNLFRMVRCLQSRGILPAYTAPRPYSEDDLLKGLEAAHTEARYPVPLPFHLTRDQHGKERFRIPSNTLRMYHDPLGETAPRDYARSMARVMLKRIASDFSVRIPNSKVSTKISDEDWERFANVFLRE